MKPISVILAVGVLGVMCLPSADFVAGQWRRVVVISDVHGDDLGFLKSLWIGLRTANETESISFEDFQKYMNSFVNAESEALAGRSAPLYRGEDVLLVQMGDLIDRGMNGRTCYRILSVIERAIGFTTRYLYGNHDFAAAVGFPYKSMIHPNDDMRRGLAFGPDGYLTQELMNNALLAVRVAGSTLFVHGGLHKGWMTEAAPDPSVEGLNEFAHLAIKYASENLLNVMLAPTSPLLYRPVVQSCEELTEILSRFGVKRMVVGHTVQMSRRVSSLCNDRLVFSDVMISRWMLNANHDPVDRSGGQASAIIITPGEEDTIEAFYTESFESDMIFSRPLIDLDAPVVPENNENEPELRLLIQDGSMTIRVAPEGFIVEFNSQFQMEQMDYIREHMVHLPGIPNIQPLVDRSGIKRVRFSDRSKYLFQPASCEIVGETIGDKIVTVVKQFHERNFCVGLKPKSSDMEMDAVDWIMRFFHIRGDQLTLLNMGRVHPCSNEWAMKAELDYLEDALDVKKIRFVDGGVSSRCRNSEAMLELITPALTASQFGLPSRVEVADDNHLFISTPDTISLANMECDANLAHQMEGVVQHMHSHNLCVLPRSDKIADIMALFTLNNKYDQVTLVDFSSVRVCGDRNEKASEFEMLHDFLAVFIDDSDLDEEDEEEEDEEEEEEEEEEEDEEEEEEEEEEGNDSNEEND